MFCERLDKLKQTLTPGSSDNLSLMSKLMDIAENHLSTSRAACHVVSPSTFLKSAGKPEVLISNYKMLMTLLIVHDRCVH